MAGIVNDGVEAIRDFVEAEYNFCQVGTSDAVFDYTHDALQSFEAEETVTIESSPAASDGGAELELEATFTDINATIEESGLFDDEQIESPNMLARGVFDEAATMTEEDKLEVTWNYETKDSTA